MNPNKLNIGLIFGGKSGEHNVSIKSAINVCHALKSKCSLEKYNVVPIYIDKKGCWWPSSIAELALKKSSELNQSDLPIRNLNGLNSFPNVTETVDVWFPLVHGPNGEDGSLQGLFQLTGKPYVGAGLVGSAICMDKIAMKSAFHSAGINQVAYKYINRNTALNSNKLKEFIDKSEFNIGYPCFTKPASLGSSVGISKAKNRNELEKGIRIAIEIDKKVIVEKGVNARELECGVLGVKHLQTSLVGEVIFDSDWYNYECKYTPGLSKTLIPAPIPPELQKEVQEISLKACDATNVSGMARVDFFYSEKENELLINEINTIPGFTSQSMYPMLWDASGLRIEELIIKLVETATK
tara:strand:- start:3265 stop:4323 length:1059 start_codon:yes stop_codon:yes gene_type:complete